jgi:hypothetical protein
VGVKLECQVTAVAVAAHVTDTALQCLLGQLNSKATNSKACLLATLGL